MSTRSTISIKNDDGSIDSVYCHFDGHPDSNGNKLLDNYDTEDKARELINLGDISSLGETIEETEDYYRMRGDPINISHYKPNEIQEYLNDSQDYNYLFDDGMWWVGRYREKKLPLDQIIMERKMENFYPSINEVYHPEWLDFDFDIDDAVPVYLRKEFRKVVRLISTELENEGYQEIQIEDYLKKFIEQIV